MSKVFRHCSLQSSIHTPECRKSPMKGPGYKLSHDVRRTWRCPACGFERKLVGDVTSLVCNCRAEGTFMAIVAERTVAPRPFQVPQEHDVRSSEFGIEDMPVLLPHPSSLPPERSGPRRPRPEGTGSEPTVKPPSEPAVVEKPVERLAEKPSETISAKPPEATPVPEQKQDLPDNPVDDEADDWGEGIL